MVLARSTQSNKDQKGIGGRIGFTTDSDTADNEPKDDSYIEAESLKRTYHFFAESLSGRTDERTGRQRKNAKRMLAPTERRRSVMENEADLALKTEAVEHPIL